MQTRMAQQFLETAQGAEADAILRSCVHCGFCTATCPTYQLLGDELDGPRGRIYLIKQLLEGNEATTTTQLHLDRCLTCRSCETTCPSGVRYGRLLDIGRSVVEQQVKRPALERFKRWLLRGVLPYPTRFEALLQAVWLFRETLPKRLRKKIPLVKKIKMPKVENHPRKMLLLAGCVQSVVTPETSAAALRVFDRLGIELIRAEGAGCCGALSHHLSAEEEALNFMRRNIDAWWPHIEMGAEALLIGASGCGVTVKQYGELLKHDPGYAEKAAQVSAMATLFSEALQREPAEALGSLLEGVGRGRRIAFHSPCTLQHGQKLTGLVESILTRAGFELTEIADSHLCCGSAGSYSLLQPKLSQQLLDNKVENLERGMPELIVTANIGCQMHIGSQAEVPVKHWIELFGEMPRYLPGEKTDCLCQDLPPAFVEV